MSTLTSLRAILDSNTNCAIYDFLLATTSDTTHADRSNNSNTLGVQFNRKFQSIDASLGGQKHASGMRFQPTSSPGAGNATIIIGLQVDPSDTDFYVTPEVRADGTATVIAYTCHVDGTVVSPSTRVALRTAIGTSALKTVRVIGLPDGEFGRGSADWVGYIRRAVLIDEAAITGTDYTDAVSLAEAWVSEVVQDVQPPFYTDPDTFFSASISGAVTLQPGLLTDADTFYSATLTPGAVTLLPPLASSANAFYVATVNSLVTLSAPLLSDGDSFFGPTVAIGAATLSPSLFSDGDTFYSPTVAFAATNLYPPLVGGAVAEVSGLRRGVFQFAQSFAS